MAAPIENGFRLVLTAVDDGLAKAWTRYCGRLPGVEIHRGSILDVQCDAMVSPANSFGFMDGGVDALYVRRFGSQLPLRVRDQILEHHGGELLVGEADIVETGDNDVPFLICAPTMRVPMVLGETVSPYLAARAVLRLLRHGSFRGAPFPGVAIRDLVGAVAMPGLGTGTGGVPPAICARQVRAAFEDVVLGRFAMPATGDQALEQHRGLYTEKPSRLP